MLKESPLKILDKEFEIFIKKEDIKSRVKEIASQISQDYAGKNPVFIAVLNGSFIFAADLMKEISIPAEISFIKVASYYHTSSTGEVKKLIGLQEDITQRNVIIIEDIVDTGLTMAKIKEEVMMAEPSSLEVATLLVKPETLKEDLSLKYVGFEIPNKFVVGYGLDYNGYGRNLKAIYQINSSENNDKS